MAGAGKHNELTVKVRLSLEDYIQANRVLLKNRFYIMIGFYSLFGLFIGIYPSIRKGQELGFSLILQGVIVGVAMSALASFLESATMKVKAKKIFESNKKLSKQQIYGLSSEGIEVQTQDGSGLIPWAGISKYVETDSGFYLFTGKKRALVIPKRVLKNENGLRLFKKILQENIGKIRTPQANVKSTEEGDQEAE